MPAAETPNPNGSCADAELQVMGKMRRSLRRCGTAGDGGAASSIDGVHRRRRRQMVGPRVRHPAARWVWSSVGGDAAGLDAELARVAAKARHWR